MSSGKRSPPKKFFSRRPVHYSQNHQRRWSMRSVKTIPICIPLSPNRTTVWTSCKWFYEPRGQPSAVVQLPLPEGGTQLGTSRFNPSPLCTVPNKMYKGQSSDLYSRNTWFKFKSWQGTGYHDSLSLFANSGSHGGLHLSPFPFFTVHNRYFMSLDVILCNTCILYQSNSLHGVAG